MEKISDLVINLDEAGINEWADRKSKKVIATVQQDNGQIYHAVTRKKRTTTILPTINLSEDSFIPMIIIRRKTIDVEVFEKELREDFDVRIRSSDNGFITTEIFNEYIEETIIPYVQNKRRKMNLPKEEEAISMDNCSWNLSE